MHVSYIAIIVAFLLVNTIAASVDKAGLKIRKRGLRRRNSILPDIVLPQISTQQQQQPARAQSYPPTYAYPAGYPAYYQPTTANTAVYSPPVAQAAAAPVAQSPPAAAAAPATAAPAPATTVAQPIQLLAPASPKKEDDDDEEEEDEDEPDEEDYDADDLVTK